uniref:5-aminolevulinate synthase n=1 Tax=Roseinatronobacter sp. TaxID=1945755 RepID=UPI0025F4E1DD
VGMKFAALGSYPVGMVLILAGFILATVAEVFLLRRGDLTVVYVTIIGIETLMILGAAVMLGEIVDLRRMMGAGCVVVGIALCST